MDRLVLRMIEAEMCRLYFLPTRWLFKHDGTQMLSQQLGLVLVHFGHEARAAALRILNNLEAIALGTFLQVLLDSFL